MAVLSICFAPADHGRTCGRKIHVVCIHAVCNRLRFCLSPPTQTHFVFHPLLAGIAARYQSINAIRSMRCLVPTRIIEDFKKVRQGHVPDRIDVTLRCAVVCFLAYVLAAGDQFVAVIPQSQTVLIATITPTLTLLFPTMMFSIQAALFPAQIIVPITAYAIATMLLACVAGVDRNLYVAMYGLTAFIVSGSRLDTQTAPMGTLLMMQIALNTVNFVEPVENGGFDFIRSMWADNKIFIDGIVDHSVNHSWTCPSAIQHSQARNKPKIATGTLD